MKKTLLLFICLLTIAEIATAQLLPLHSQYMNNQYLINPAVAGTNDFTDIVISYRSQWNNIDGAPEQFYISANGFLDKRKPGLKTRFQKHGVGGVLHQENIGSFRRQFIMMSYAYHLPLNKIYLSMGVSAGLQRQNLDFSRVNFLDDSDPYFVENENNLDFNFSMMAYGPNFHLGFSAFQLENNFSDVSGRETYWLANAGYRWQTDSKVEFAPSMVVRYAPNVPLNYDINFKARYNEVIWSGISYRNSQALVAMLGFNLSPSLEFNYSFDLPIDQPRLNDWTSHEVAIRFKIRHRDHCPSYFW